LKHEIEKEECIASFVELKMALLEDSNPVSFVMIDNISFFFSNFTFD